MAECVGSLYAKNVSTQESMFPLANVLMAEYLSPKAAQSRPIVDAQCISLIIVKSHTSSQDSGKLPVPFLPAVWQSSGQTLRLFMLALKIGRCLTAHLQRALNQGGSRIGKHP